MDGYRPVTSLNSSYLIMSQIMANRLKTVIRKCVHPQPGTLSVRDNVASMKRVLDHVKEENTPAMLVKVRFDQPFDLIRHTWIWETMEAMGMGGKFTTMLKNILSTVTNKVEIDAHLTDSIPMTKGLRLGDPLTPQLYLIARQPLIANVESLVREGRIKGLQVGTEPVSVDYSAFPDDLGVYMQVDKSSFEELTGLLTEFEDIMGAKFNLQKSTIVMFGGPDEIPEWVKNSGCKRIYRL